VKKYVVLIFLFFITSYSLFSIVEVNDYNDVGLVEKNGTYGYSSPMYKNSFTSFFSVSSNSSFIAGFRLKLLLEVPELAGFYFYGNFFLDYNKVNTSLGADMSYWFGFAPYFGESYFGYKNKFLSLKLGFQNFVSSDAIYNHLFIDDYSGSFFGLRFDSMISRFFDSQLFYIMVRPDKGSFLSNSTVFDTNGLLFNTTDSEQYNGLYGKSLYMHKFNIRPLSWIRVGVIESVYFLGENLNPWYANPFFSYFASTAIADTYKTKNGGAANTGAYADFKLGFDCSIGFNGWKLYGELMIDDGNAGYLKFSSPSHPDRLGFVFGAELRGYLFTKYIKMDKIASYIVSNLYVNCEYGAVSKYTYDRDSNYSYEYVRQEYLGKYDPAHPPSQTEIDKINRIGNFIGFMYGSNSDCFDFSVGWRNDLSNVKENNAEYQADVYLDSLKKKKLPDRLIKIQLHYRRYRLGDERNVIVPFFYNEHYAYDLDPDFDSNGDGDPTNDAPGLVAGLNRKTEFLSVVVEEGDLFDINVYSDIFKASRFTIGAETKFGFNWITKYPGTAFSSTTFNFKWDLGISLNW
jgi:hypothetical protein